MNGSERLSWSIEVGSAGVSEIMATSSPDWLVEWVREGTFADAGVSVTGSSSLRFGPVYQAVTVVAGDFAQLPMMAQRKREDGTWEEDPTHQGHRIIADRPNQMMLPNVFKELLMGWALLWGNGCAAIERNISRPVELIPLLPDRTGREEVDGIWYYVSRINGEWIKFRPENVFHLMGLSQDGIWGRSVFDLAKNSIGLGIALEKHGNKNFKHAARPSGVIERPIEAGPLSPEARQNLRAEWSEMHEGLDNVGKTAIFQEGMKFNPLSIANTDAQWLESRRFSREEIAAWFNLPPHKLGAMEQSSVRANLTEQNRDYLWTTLMRWITKWQEEADDKLRTSIQKQRRSHRFKVATKALLRADLLTRYRSYQLARAGEWMSPNEIRAEEDMPPYDGGDDWQNPNTRSGNGNGSDQESDMQPSEETESGTDGNEEAGTNERDSRAAALGKLVIDRIGHLCDVEKRKILEAARSKKNFIRWLDDFYLDGGGFVADADTFLCPIKEVLSQDGFDWDMLCESVADYANASRARLLDLSGHATAKELEDYLKPRLDGWKNRRSCLVASIMEGSRNGDDKNNP